ncbi:MAG: hypothetical protein HY529_01960 [Chloroflexi bacterium]|nr:hypothetical protein [Chloroflexota bacterium]
MATTIQPEIIDQDLKALRQEIERKTGKTPEQLYEEREKRVRDAIEVNEPDRVPLHIGIPNQRFGLPQKEALRKGVLYFEPDLCTPSATRVGGPVSEILGIQNRVWAGHGLSEDATGQQAIEGEYMKADEYDLFLKDPADFSIRCYLPRVYSALAPLAKLPPLSMLYSGGLDGIAALFATPEFEQMGKALAKAGQGLRKPRQQTYDPQEDLALLGFPPFYNSLASAGGAPGGAPFDVISAHLRGMTGSMLDMYQRPEKLLQACDMIAEMKIARGVPADPTKRGNPKRIGMPLWRGDNMFMSQKQFEKFYWPGLKKVMLAAIELGYVPVPFFEDEFGDRLECLLDLPKGKVIASVEHMDVVRAKEILGGHCCVLGKAPHSSRFWSLREAEEYYKNLLKVCGKGGGFILRVTLPDRGDLEDLKAMVDSVREYGVYS